MGKQLHNLGYIHKREEKESESKRDDATSVLSASSSETNINKKNEVDANDDGDLMDVWGVDKAKTAQMRKTNKAFRRWVREVLKLKQYHKLFVQNRLDDFRVL